MQKFIFREQKGRALARGDTGRESARHRCPEKNLDSGRLSYGKPYLMRSVLGVEPGSVTPFAVINETAKADQVVLQRRMMEMDLLNYHPLRNDATTTLTPSDLLEFMGAMGHDPLVLDT